MTDPFVVLSEYFSSEAELPDAAKIAAGYASFMDEATLEKLDAKPLAPWLAGIRKVKTKDDFTALMGRANTAPYASILPVGITIDAKSPTRYAVTSGSGGLGLPDRLHTAVRDCRKMKLNEGRRRQLQFIGKLMRQVDARPIQAAVDEFHLGGARQTLALHEAERWREELLAGDEAITRWLGAHPGTDAQHLRALLRSARKEAQAPLAPGQEARHGRAYRELFQLVREHLGGAAGADEPPADDNEADDE